MSVSAVMIAYNEEELLPSTLMYLESVRNISEIIIVVDQDTDDRTIPIIEQHSVWTSKIMKWKTAKFTSFGGMRNLGHDMATQDWILIMDPDEVFTPQLDSLLFDVINMPHVNAVKMPCITMYKDRRHYLSQDTLGMDPHIHLHRRNFARYPEEIHENLIDTNGRLLQTSNDSDILITYTIQKYHDVGMKHLQLLKSDAALITKGMRWKHIGGLEASAAKGIPVRTHTWLEWKHWAFTTHRVIGLPLHLYDITSNL